MKLRTPTDLRLLEIMRAFVKEHSTEVCRPDMTDERLLLQLMHLAVDETRALNQVELPGEEE
jgi:hypothetical protein